MSPRRAENLVRRHHDSPGPAKLVAERVWWLGVPLSGVRTRRDHNQLQEEGRSWNQLWVAKFSGEDFSEINDNSVAILLTHGTARILLTGDAEANEEEYMANGHRAARTPHRPTTRTGMS
jgi:hypothetical protein